MSLPKEPAVRLTSKVFGERENGGSFSVRNAACVRPSFTVTLHWGSTFVNTVLYRWQGVARPNGDQKKEFDVSERIDPVSCGYVREEIDRLIVQDNGYAARF